MWTTPTPMTQTGSQAKSLHLPLTPTLPLSPKQPPTPLYHPSPIPQCQSPQPLSQKSSSPEIICIQQSQRTQTDHPTDHPISHIPPSSPNKSKSTTQTLTISLGYSTTLSTPSTQLHPTIPRDLPLMSLGKSPPFHPPKQFPDQSMPSPRKVTHPWRTPSSFVKF